MSLPVKNRLVVLAERPKGRPTAATFRLIEASLPELRDGQALVRNDLMSVDPAMRPRMNDVPSYMPPFVVGEPLDGRAVGEVIASKHPKLPVGATVRHGLGWREYAIVDDGTVVDTVAREPASGTQVDRTAAGIVGSRMRAGDRLISAAPAPSATSPARSPSCWGNGDQQHGLQRTSAICVTGCTSIAFRPGWKHHADLRARRRMGSTSTSTTSAARRSMRRCRAQVHGRIATCGMIAGYNRRIGTAILHGKRLRMRASS